jgi:hypothetical protein
VGVFLVRRPTTAAALGCLALAFGAAQATPITTGPLPPLTGFGVDVKAVFVYASAADKSELKFGSTLIFCNKTITGTCTQNNPGDLVNLGPLTGPLTFTLVNTTTHKTYDTKNPDSFGDYHADIRTSYTYAGVPALSPSLAALLASLPNVTYVAFEDRQKNNGSDFDYNDLIFAFSNTRRDNNPGVPEPLTLSLLGAGLLGAFGLRRRK